MSRCRHQAKAYTWWTDDRGSRWINILVGSVTLPLDRLVCEVCHEWLPLGPANDTPETAVEVRASAIAADWWREPRPGLTNDEVDGLTAYTADLTPVSDGQLSGWLAAAIYMHKESDRG